MVVLMDQFMDAFVNLFRNMYGSDVLKTTIIDEQAS